jgi:hypothetical protein
MSKNSPTVVDWVLGLTLYASIGAWLALVYLASTGAMY